MAWPGEAVRAEDEERDRVQSPAVHEDGGSPVEEVADRAALQREVLVASERHHWCKVHAAGEPWLDLVNPSAFDVERSRSVEHAEVVVDRLRDHGRGRVALAEPGQFGRDEREPDDHEADDGEGGPECPCPPGPRDALSRYGGRPLPG